MWRPVADRARAPPNSQSAFIEAVSVGEGSHCIASWSPLKPPPDEVRLGVCVVGWVCSCYEFEFDDDDDDDDGRRLTRVVR